MAKIIFDIETAGEDFDKMDEVTQEMLTKKVKMRTKTKKDFEQDLQKTKDDLVFSPLTSEIVAVGVLDAETKKGAVYYQNLDNKEGEIEEDGVKLKVMTEVEILHKFWEIVEKSDEMVSFNGRGFDVPFLMLRSAIHKIRPTRNLLANRYLNLQPHNCKHIDLMDQMNFYGATWGKVNLHLACRAFGIKSPKEDGVSGDDVTRLFREKKYLDIARYNARDLFSTAELFLAWEKYLKL